jgi:hypothetical protein
MPKVIGVLASGVETDDEGAGDVAAGDAAGGPGG